jgi:hypothetical protein
MSPNGHRKVSLNVLPLLPRRVNSGPNSPEFWTLRGPTAVEFELSGFRDNQVSAFVDLLPALTYAPLNIHGLNSSTGTPACSNSGRARLTNDVFPNPHAPNTPTTTPSLASSPRIWRANERAALPLPRVSLSGPRIGLSLRAVFFNSLEREDDSLAPVSFAEVFRKSDPSFRCGPVRF